MLKIHFLDDLGSVKIVIGPSLRPEYLLFSCFLVVASGVGVERLYVGLRSGLVPSGAPATFLCVNTVGFVLFALIVSAALVRSALGREEVVFDGQFLAMTWTFAFISRTKVYDAASISDFGVEVRVRKGRGHTFMLRTLSFRYHEKRVRSRLLLEPSEVKQLVDLPIFRSGFASSNSGRNA